MNKIICITSLIFSFQLYAMFPPPDSKVYVILTTDDLLNLQNSTKKTPLKKGDIIKTQAQAPVPRNGESHTHLTVTTEGKTFPGNPFKEHLLNTASVTIRSYYTKNTQGNLFSQTEHTTFEVE